MKRGCNISRTGLGFSLAEMLAALTIGAMVLVAVLGIYNRADNVTTAILHKLNSSQLPSEVLQRIAEDLDEIIAAGSDMRITIDNKYEKGFATARMIIRKTIYDSKNTEQTFEETIWQSSYDYDNDANSLVLYRSHRGIALEDKVLDAKRAGWESDYSFVPICDGVTYFGIEVPRGETFQDRWSGSSPPPGVRVTISFAEPFLTVRGTLDVPDAEKITRTIAIDRSRKINFKVKPAEDTQGQGNEEQL